MKLFLSFVMVLGFGFSALANEGVRSCVSTRTLGGWEAVDAETLVFGRGSRAVTMTVRGCDVTRADKISWRLHTSFICRGDTVTLLDNWGYPVGSCRITEITR